MLWMVLIETYWNVKVISQKPFMLICCVLIETYWNVKYSVCGWKNIPSVVLIETYWNVKKPDSEPKLDSESNINRNILECKVRKNTKSTTH